MAVERRLHIHISIGGCLVAFVVVLSSLSPSGNTTGAPAVTPPPQEGPHSSSNLLVKFKQAPRTKLRSGNPAQTGLATLDRKFAKFKAQKFERLGRLSQRAKAQAELFGWYKVSLDPDRPITAVKKNGRLVYPDLEQLEAELKSDPNVESVSKDYEVKTTLVPNDPYYSSTGSWSQSYDDLWGLKQINAAGAWDITTGSSSVVAAVIDTGLDRTHPDIAANVWTNPGEINANGLDDDGNGYADDYYGWNFFAGSNNTTDDNGHGTHVAGTIAAAGNNGTGVPGMSWNTKIMPLKFLDSSGSGYMSDAVMALQYAADMGAKVSNNSWRCLCTTDTAIDDAIAYERTAGVVPVVAAGNDSANALDAMPAASDGAITVAATSTTNTLASFSNTGPRVDVVAPGVDILSLKAAGGSPTCPAGVTVNTNYCHISGTSMAAPHVTGLVALMLARNNGLTVEQVRQILRTNATDLGTAGRDATFGSGLVNAAAAVVAAGSPTVLAPVITAPGTRATISGTTSFMGTAAGSGFASYKLEAGAGRNPGSWITLKTTATPVTGSTLLNYDTANLSDGSYTFRLTATTSGGLSYEYSIYDVTVDNFDLGINTPLNIMPKTAAVDIVGTALAKNGASFDHYTLEWGSGTSPSSWSTSGLTLAGGGNSAVSGASLGSWNTSSLTDGQPYTLRLTVYEAGGSASILTQTVAVEADLAPGWPKYLPGANCGDYCSAAGPVFADLDLDGDQEAVIPAATNKIYAFNKDGSAVTGFPVTVTGGDYFVNQPVVADLDGDLKPEIIANAVVGTSDTRRLYIIKGDGSLYPGSSQPVLEANSITYDLTPTVGDIDNDGRPELVLINYLTGTGVRMYAYHADGSSATGFPKTLSVNAPWITMPVTIADLDSDGQTEIIYARYNQLYVLNGAGTVRTGWPKTLPNNGANVETIQGPPAVGDVDGDGVKDIIVTGQKNGALFTTFRVYAYGLAGNGSLLSGWPATANNNDFVGLPWNVASTADIDGDGRDEVMVGQSGSSVIDHGTGRRSTSSFMGQGQLSMADFAGDGNIKFPGSYNPGLQWGNEDLSVYWNNNYFDSLASETASANPFIVSDLDRNSQQDFAATIVHNNEEYIYLFELPGATTPADSWPMFTHDPARTSHYTAGQTGADTAAPQVVVASPSAGSTVSGTVTVRANAVDNTAVTSVEFYNNGTLISTDSSYPFTASWDTAGVTPGSRSLTAKAFDAAGNSTTSAAVAVTVPDTAAPAVPANLNTTSATATTITLAWDAAVDNLATAGYRIYRGGSQIGTATGLTYTDTGRTPNTSYSYTVAAYDAAGNVSAQSATHNAGTTADTTAPSVPAGLGGAGLSDSSIGLSWTASTDDVGVTGYRIYRDGSQSGTSATTTYTDTGRTPGTAYSYTVRAYDAAGNLSAASAAANLTTQPDATPPSPAGNLHAAAATVTSITLAWDAATDNANVTGYRVFRAGNQIATVTTGLTYADSGRTPGTTYSYGVEAYDAAGNTSSRITASLATPADTTAPTAPANAAASSITASGAVMSWTASTDDVAVTGYRVYVDGVQVATTAQTNYTLTGLAASTIYTVTIRAYDAAGNLSGNSGAVTVITSAAPPAPAVAPAKRGDVNRDNQVNVFDLSLLLAKWGTGGPTGDLDANGTVNIFDLSIVLHEYGK